MAQELIVGLIVASAAFYAVWRWMPAGWRRSAARKVATGTQRAGLVDAERAEQLAASLAKTSGEQLRTTPSRCNSSSAPLMGR